MSLVDRSNLALLVPFLCHFACQLPSDRQAGGTYLLRRYSTVFVPYALSVRIFRLVSIAVQYLSVAVFRCVPNMTCDLLCWDPSVPGSYRSTSIQLTDTPRMGYHSARVPFAGVFSQARFLPVYPFAPKQGPFHREADWFSSHTK
ncbi:hypothetical protein B0H12DRAFT_1096939 [Mycena haematopus]|nr:hypothetical protein B0H12DRAFT_1096939 [Mycena haematopus]